MRPAAWRIGIDAARPRPAARHVRPAAWVIPGTFTWHDQPFVGHEQITWVIDPFGGGRIPLPGTYGSPGGIPLPGTYGPEAGGTPGRIGGT